MTYAVNVWVPDEETGGEKVASRFPCSICEKLFEEIHVINDWIQLCHDCNRGYK